MLGNRLFFILAALFAFVLLWLCLSLIKLGLSNLDAPKIPTKTKIPENIFIKGDAKKGQQIAGQVCAGCHSPDGNSLSPVNPILAGQHAEYIAKQLADFKGNKESPAKRKNPIMSAMVDPLSTDDMKNLGAYYTLQKPNPGTAKDKVLAEQGEKIYRGGNIESGVPACAGCHSPNGVGIPPFYPRLTGQYAEYTMAQLRAFRTEQRANDVNNVMRELVARMSEKEMFAVSEFISGLQ